MAKEQEQDGGRVEESRPEWLDQILESYGLAIAHGFILHFNINDYAGPDKHFACVDYLCGEVASYLIVKYSRNGGIDFLTDAHKKQAVKILTDIAAKKSGETQEEEVDEATKALREVENPGAANVDFPTDPEAAIGLLDLLLRWTNEDENSETRIALIIEDAELLCPNGELATMQPVDRVCLATMRRWGNDSQIIGSGNLVILLTPNVASLHTDLIAASARFEQVAVGLPRLDDRIDFIQEWCALKNLELEGMSIQEIANQTSGLGYMSTEDILLRAAATGQIDPGLIETRKKELIRAEFGEVLEILSPRYTFDDIGGLEYIKTYFRKNVVQPMLRGRKRRVPMGVAFTGAAGTGKTIVANALGAEAGINVAILRIGGQIASKWQGEGERRLAKAIEAIKALAPCAVFMDEIDQQVSRGGGAGGNQQESRIFQMLLEFMSDESHRGEIVFLGATNRPDLMDAALKRPGRFDKFILFVTEYEERLGVLKIETQKWFSNEELPQKGKALEATFKSLAKQTEGWTGAEVKSGVVEAIAEFEDALDDGKKIPVAKALERAFKKLKPRTKDVQYMTWLGVQESDGNPDLLPPSLRTAVGDEKVIEEKLELYAPRKIERSERKIMGT